MLNNNEVIEMLINRIESNAVNQAFIFEKTEAIQDLEEELESCEEQISEMREVLKKLTEIAERFKEKDVLIKVIVKDIATILADFNKSQTF